MSFYPRYKQTPSPGSILGFGCHQGTLSRTLCPAAMKSCISRALVRKSTQQPISYLLSSSSSSISIYFRFAALPGAELSSLESWARRIFLKSSWVSSLLVLTAAALAFRSSMGILFTFSAFGKEKGTKESDLCKPLLCHNPQSLPPKYTSCNGNIVGKC